MTPHTSTTGWTIERVPTPIGALLLITDDADRLRALDWEDHSPRLRRLLRLHYGVGHESSVHDQTRDTDIAGDALAAFQPRHTPSTSRVALSAYFAGHLSAIDNVTVATGGTAFQRTVWAALRGIRAGQTTSYGALAQSIERPRAVRAVARSNAENPVGIIVPCHRVIGASGHLTGYAGGLERKQWLLDHERAFAS